MNKKVIAIISVLKPVDDPRNYEKIATSLGNTNKYDINIIGFKSKNIPASPCVTIHPEFSFRRKSFKRLAAPFKIGEKLIKLKPELVIVTCAELLVVTCLYKILFGCRIIYDVQENYFRNFLYSGAYSRLLKYPVAVLVRLLEYATAPLIDQFFLAEHIYARQLHFIGKRFIVLENKALLPEGFKKASKPQSEQYRFLYCGTITRHYGALEAITFYKNLQKLFPEATLTIIGHAPEPRFFSEVRNAATNYPGIFLLGDGGIIPHSEILKEMSSTDFVLLPYHSGPNVEGRIPTKLYECLAHEIPVIIPENASWSYLILENNAGIMHDFKGKIQPELIESIRTYSFFEKQTTDSFLWASIENELLTNIQAALGR